MRITWLGHSGFRIEIAGEVLLVDPWLEGNPMFDAARRGEAIAGATRILVSHGHSDHTASAVGIAGELGIPIVGKYELVSHWASESGVEVVGFNTGGTVRLGEVGGHDGLGHAFLVLSARRARSMPAARRAT